MMFKIFVKNKYNSGLTIIELLVVVSIFVIVTGLSIFNYNNFNSSVSTQNLADDIALSIRKAQGYAIGVQGIGNTFNSGYGIHFSSNINKTSPYASSKESFVLFMDINDNKSYDYKEGIDGKCGEPEYGNECIEVLDIKSNDEIKDIYINDLNNPISNEEVVNILFKRPDPEPHFYNKFGTTLDSASIIKIKVINLNDPLNIYKIISISNTGQISVLNQ
jgi:type II secretory pathway pseudopilin PulG